MAEGLNIAPYNDNDKILEYLHFPENTFLSIADLEKKHTLKDGSDRGGGLLCIKLINHIIIKGSETPKKVALTLYFSKPEKETNLKLKDFVVTMKKIYDNIQGEHTILEIIPRSILTESEKKQLETQGTNLSLKVEGTTTAHYVTLLEISRNIIDTSSLKKLFRQKEEEKIKKQEINSFNEHIKTCAKNFQKEELSIMPEGTSIVSMHTPFYFTIPKSDELLCKRSEETHFNIIRDAIDGKDFYSSAAQITTEHCIDLGMNVIIKISENKKVRKYSSLLLL